MLITTENYTAHFFQDKEGHWELSSITNVEYRRQAWEKFYTLA